MLVEYLAGDWSRLLDTASQAISFLTQPNGPVRLQEPVEAGVIRWTSPDTQLARPWIEIQPFALAQPGAQFTMRVSTWAKRGNSNTKQAVWVQSSGSDFLCTVGAIPGYPTPGGGGVEMDGDERFCSTMVLTAGSLGAGIFQGWVNSYPANLVMPAWALVPVLGARKVKIEFASADPSGAVGMNCFWSQG